MAPFRPNPKLAVCSISKVWHTTNMYYYTCCVMSGKVNANGQQHWYHWYCPTLLALVYHQQQWYHHLYGTAGNTLQQITYRSMVNNYIVVCYPCHVCLFLYCHCNLIVYLFVSVLASSDNCGCYTCTCMYIYTCTCMCTKRVLSPSLPHILPRPFLPSFLLHCALPNQCTFTHFKCIH